MRFLKNTWAAVAVFCTMVFVWVFKDRINTVRASAALTARSLKYSEENRTHEAHKAKAARTQAKAERHLANADRYADRAALSRRTALETLDKLKKETDRDEYIKTFNRLAGRTIDSLKASQPTEPSSGRDPDAP